MAKITPKNRMIAFMKTDFRCFYCGSKFKDDLWDACLDHVIPSSRGGVNNHSNLVPSCRSCNSSKSTKTLEEYRLVCWGKSEFPGVNLTYIQASELLRMNAITAKNPPESFKFYFEDSNNGNL